MKSGKMLKNLIQKAKHLPELQEPIPTGTLTEEQLNLRLSAHHGLPRTASILAFNPIQRLLAVASLDGCIKVFGVAGVEVRFQSPSDSPCNFLKFNSGGQLFHITADNDIEVWDLEQQKLVSSLKWESDITACTVIPGTPFLYIGDDFGTVSVIQYDAEQQQLIQPPYGIPAHVTLGGLVRAGSTSAPSVVSILPQLDAIYSRLVIAYASGLLILWGLHEKKVLAVRGGTKRQRQLLAEHGAHLQDSACPEVLADQLHFSPPKGTITLELDEEEKEICTVCWACGNTLVAGYVDGDVWLWSFPPITKGRSETNFPFSSGEPLRKLDLVPGKSSRMPVIVLTWFPSGKGSKNGAGQLYVFGGGEVGSPEVLTVVSLEEASDKKVSRLELLLHGPFADLLLLPCPSTTQMAALLLLTSPGQLHLYDEAGIATCFSAENRDTSSSSLQPVAWPTPIAEATAAKFELIPQDSAVASTLRQLSQDCKEDVPSVLPGGTKWPITGGRVGTISASRQTSLLQSIIVTALKSGSVQMWNTSTPTLRLVHRSDTNASFISALDFCPESEYLAVGSELGEVSVLSLNADHRTLSCHLINSIDVPKGTDSSSKVLPGLQCVVLLRIHKAAIKCVTIASGMQRLAAGDATGLISVLDLANRSLLYVGNPFDSKVDSSILSLGFATAKISEGGISPSPPSSPFGSRKRPSSPSVSTSVIYAANTQGSVTVIDAGTGRGVLSPGPVNLRDSSTAVSMHLLDASGVPLRKMSNKIIKEAATHQPFPPAPVSDASFVLLCLEDSVRLYSASSVIQGVRKALRKVKLHTPCLHACPFESTSTHSSGLFLLYRSGQVEVWSLPDLGLVQERTLKTFLNCKLQPNTLKQFSWTPTGQIAMVAHPTTEGISSCFPVLYKEYIFGSSELVQLSLLAHENIPRPSDSTPSLIDKELVIASAAATDAPFHAPKKKSMIGGIMKDTKSSVEQTIAIDSAVELQKLFSSRPFTIPSTNSRSKSSAESSSSHLEIDDIDIDEGMPSSPRTSMTRKQKLVIRLKRGLKGKDKNNEADNRAQLLGEQPAELSPQVRSADSIKAAYGHKPTGDSASIAAMSRDKLIERQEKLQAINKQSEELQDGAGNFASLAEELAKKIENRKWTRETSCLLRLLSGKNCFIAQLPCLVDMRSRVPDFQGGLLSTVLNQSSAPSETPSFRTSYYPEPFLEFLRV